MSPCSHNYADELESTFLKKKKSITGVTSLKEL